MSEYSIRPLRAGNKDEIDRLYEICLLTGDAGNDASSMYTDPRLLGELYVGAYATLHPEFAFVLVDGTDQPVGYAVGVADSLAFDRELEGQWWPPLRAAYSQVKFTAGSPDSDLIQTLMRWAPTHHDVASRYPAHFHIDILPQAQGEGRGRELLFTLLNAFWAAGVLGVHLGVSAKNTRAIGFYEHVGFHTVSQEPWGQTMGMSAPRLD